MVTRKNSGARSALYWLGLIAILFGANVWVFNQAFFKKNVGELPRLDASLVSASAFVIKNEFGQENDFEFTRNILVLGQAGPGHIAPDLTDTIAVVRLNGPARQVKIISVPRDLAVKTAGGVTKINALYQIGLKESEKAGLDLIKSKVEEVTGLGVDDFVVFDLNTVKKVIDDIGGLNVYVQDDILDTRFPTDRGLPGQGGYETFKLAAGSRFLSGEDALKFVRTRHSPGGDFDRARRQQQVLKALKGKIASLNPVWDFPKLWNIFKTVQSNLRTNLELGDLKTMWELSKNMDLEKIETLGLNTENGLVAAEKMKFGGITADVLVAKPEKFEYDKIQNAIQDFIISND